MKVLNARHAVSIDEDRAAFAPRLMNSRANIVEKWFRGNHADIGGGYEMRGLADITLEWMLSEAHTVMGLEFKALDAPGRRHAPHRENLPLLREQRKPIVLINGEVSNLPAIIHA